MAQSRTRNDGLRRLLATDRAVLRFAGSSEAFRVRTVPDSACRVACPAGVNVKAYIGLVGAGEFERALQVVRETNPLPGICGRVCTHPCEAECRRSEVDAPVAIRLLKRFIADYALASGPDSARPDTPPGDRRVAVVGSGPAGVTAANDLARLGWPVTVFEALPRPGGMLRVGIPRFRLPHDIIDHEVGAIADVGVRIETGARVDDPARLLDEGFAAVCCAVGAHAGVPLGLEHEDDLAGIVDCVDFLRDANLDRAERLGGRVLVIGGGNSAVDSARVARRLGARDVQILYRRTRDEMPAYDEEVEDALHENITIHFLVQPVALLHRDGRVTGLRCIKTRLGRPDSGGRRRPEPVPGSEFDIKAGLVIKAAGQRPDTGRLRDSGIEPARNGTVPADPATGATRIPGVFAGGDVVTGPATVIEAIAAGHRVARGIHAFLTGTPAPTGPVAPTREPEVALAGLTAVPAERVSPGRVATRRLRTFAEVERAVTRQQAVAEARRCLRCGPCAECVQCHHVCPRHHVYLRSPGTGEELLVRLPTLDQVFPDPNRARRAELRRGRAQPLELVAGAVIARVTPELCRACGQCVESCPHDAIELRAWRAGVEAAFVVSEKCRGCGTCVTVCPSGALKDRPAPDQVDGEPLD